MKYYNNNNMTMDEELDREAEELISDLDQALDAWEEKERKEQWTPQEIRDWVESVGLSAEILSKGLPRKSDWIKEKEERSDKKRKIDNSKEEELTVFEECQETKKRYWDTLKRQFAKKEVDDESLGFEDYMFQPFFDAGCPPAPQDGKDEYEFARVFFEKQAMYTAVVGAEMKKARLEGATDEEVLRRGHHAATESYNMRERKELGDAIFKDLYIDISGTTDEEEEAKKLKRIKEEEGVEFALCEEERQKFWEGEMKRCIARRKRIDENGNDEEDPMLSLNYDLAEAFLALGRPPQTKEDKFSDVRFDLNRKALKCAIMGGAKKQATLEGATDEECQRRAKKAGDEHENMDMLGEIDRLEAAIAAMEQKAADIEAETEAIRARA